MFLYRDPERVVAAKEEKAAEEGNEQAPVEGGDEEQGEGYGDDFN